MKYANKSALKKILGLVLIPAALCLPVVAVQAHHSFSMFQRDTQMVVTGTVERWAFNNPHAWLYIKAPDKSGAEVTWGFEGGAPPQLVRSGITGRSFEPGDTVTIMFSPLVDGRPGGALCWVKTGDEYLRPADGGCGAREPDSVERWERWMEMGITSNKDPRAQ